MNNKTKISICIPYYNRADMVMDTINAVYNDPRISEFILCDDCSPTGDYKKLLANTSGMKKVKIYRNVVNFHVQHNKRNALSFAENDWVILLDNDNVIDTAYIDRLYKLREWDPNIIYHPSMAAPNFDYSEFANIHITRDNAPAFAPKNIFVTLLNTNNYFVNKKRYLSVYQYNSECRGADGIYNAYNWMNNGGAIFVLPDHPYKHRVHESSAFLAESESNMKLIYYWLEKVKKINDDIL